MNAGLCLVRCLCVEDGNRLLFGKRETSTDKTPVLFGFPHPTFFTNWEGLDSIKKLLDEMEVGVEVIGCIVSNLKGKERVVEDASPNHEVVNGGKPLAYLAEVGRSADVAIIDDFVVNEGKCAAECVEVNLS